MRVLLVILTFFYITQLIQADEFDLDKIKMDNETVYIVRLVNGDYLSGIIADSINNPTKGKAIKLITILGSPIIYLSEISRITEKKDFNRHKHRAFILPTAEPIGNDHFIGNFELLFFYAGVGLWDYVSITAGRSAIPTSYSGEQVSVINAKATFVNMEWDDYPGGLTAAVGTNIAFVNDNNRIVDYYGNMTFHIDRTYLTAAIFVKQGGDDFYTSFFRNERYDFIYENGSFGLALGINSRFSDRNDIYFIGELWNTNISKITNTGLLGGFRIANTTFAADFGLLFFTQPLFVPFISFVWTPF